MSATSQDYDGGVVNRVLSEGLELSHLGRVEAERDKLAASLDIAYRSLTNVGEDRSKRHNLKWARTAREVLRSALATLEAKGDIR